MLKEGVTLLKTAVTLSVKISRNSEGGITNRRKTYEVLKTS